MGDLQQTISLVAGNYLDATHYQQATLFLDYLAQSGIDQIKLIELYREGWLLNYSQLPQELWADSLLKPYTYYYHSKLKQVSKPCVFNAKTGAFTEENFYNEMRIILTHEQVIDDMYSIVGTLLEHQHKKRDIEALKHILEKHSVAYVGTIKIQTIDVIYMIFDKAATYSMSHTASFLDLYNIYYRNSLITLEEMCITPQKSFALRTGELVTCRGK